MRLGRRQHAAEKHHPDPAIERQLERIRSLQRRCQAKEAAISDDRDEITELQESMRNLNWQARYDEHRAGAAEAVARMTQQERTLRDEIRRAEQEVDQAHDEIARRQDKLDESDLAYL